MPCARERVDYAARGELCLPPVLCRCARFGLVGRRVAEPARVILLDRRAVEAQRVATAELKRRLVLRRACGVRCVGLLERIAVFDLPDLAGERLDGRGRQDAAQFGEMGATGRSAQTLA